MQQGPEKILTLLGPKYNCLICFVLNALYTVVGFRPMHCFPKFYLLDCFVRLHYEVIISTDVIFP